MVIVIFQKMNLLKKQISICSSSFGKQQVNQWLVIKTNKIIQCRTQKSYLVLVNIFNSNLQDSRNYLRSIFQILSQKSHPVDATYNLIQPFPKRVCVLNFFQTCFGVLSRKKPRIFQEEKEKHYRIRLKTSKHSPFLIQEIPLLFPFPAPHLHDKRETKRVSYNRLQLKPK